MFEIKDFQFPQPYTNIEESVAHPIGTVSDLVCCAKLSVLVQSAFVPRATRQSMEGQTFVETVFELAIVNWKVNHRDNQKEMLLCKRSRPPVSCSFDLSRYRYV